MWYYISINFYLTGTKEVTDIMRISPVFSQYNIRFNKNKNNQTRFERSNVSLNSYPDFKHHKYTGVASADLAYASMRDNSIASALKLMGLI